MGEEGFFSWWLRLGVFWLCLSVAISVASFIFGGSDWLTVGIGLVVRWVVVSVSIAVGVGLCIFAERLWDILTVTESRRSKRRSQVVAGLSGVGFTRDPANPDVWVGGVVGVEVRCDVSAGMFAQVCACRHSYAADRPCSICSAQHSYAPGLLCTDCPPGQLAQVIEALKMDGVAARAQGT